LLILVKGDIKQRCKIKKNKEKEDNVTMYWSHLWYKDTWLHLYKTLAWSVL